MKRLIKTFIKIITIVTLILFSIIFLGSFLVNKSLNFINNPIIIYIIGFTLLSYLLICGNRFIDKCNCKRIKLVKIISLVILIVCQIFILKSFNPVQTTDAYAVNNEAIAIAENLDKRVDVNSYTYFKQYSNNNFVLVMSICLAKFFKLIKFNYSLGFTIFNMFMIDLSILLSYLICKKVKDEKFATKILVINILNPLNYLLIHWTYTVTYSLPIMLLILYFSLFFREENISTLKKIALSICLGITIIIGYYLRPTSIISFIALLICFILYLIVKKENIKKYLLSGFIVLVTLIITYFGIANINRYYVDNSKESWPITHWIMMGLHYEGTVNGNDNSYSKGFETKEKIREANIKEIKRTLKSYNLVSFTKHCFKKLTINWGVGDANYYYRMIQDKNNSSVFNFISGSKKDIVVICCQVFRITILFFTIIGIFNLSKKSRIDFNFIIILTLFGGLLFYLIWEVKESYCVPFLPFLFVLSVSGLDLIIQRFKIKDFKGRINISFLIIVILTVLVGVLLYKPLTSTKKEVVRYSVNVAGPVGGVGYYIGNVNSKDLTIKQEFISKDKFNTICLKINALSDDKKIYYILRLINKDKEIKSYKFSINDIINGKIYFNLDENLTKKDTKYVIVIESTKNKKDSIGFKNASYKTLDIYKGDMYINDVKQNKDLVMSVYNKKKDIFLNRKVYLLDIKSLILAEVLIYAYVIKSKNLD